MTDVISTKIKDSGTRTEFKSGAVRDMRTGKGRMDLVPLDIMDRLLKISPHIPLDSTLAATPDNTFSYIDDFIYNGNTDSLISAMLDIIIHNNIYIADYLSRAKELDIDDVDIGLVTIHNLVANTIISLSKHFENGILKYGERNWEKGMDLHCYVDSAARHYAKLLAGFYDEPHHLAVLWNLACAIWTLEKKPEFNDLPFAPFANK